MSCEKLIILLIISKFFVKKLIFFLNAYVSVPILPAFLYEMQHPNESKLPDTNFSPSPPPPTPQIIIINPCNETLPTDLTLLTEGKNLT